MALLCGGSAIFFWQLRHPFLRFGSPVLNQLLGFALAFCLPWLTVIAIFRIGRWWSTAAGFIVALPLLLYTFVLFVVAIMAGSVYQNGHDLSFDRFAETPWNGSAVRFYRTDGGATTDYGVVIRQERAVFPGVLVVRRVDDFYPCYEMDAIPTDPGVAITGKDSDCTALSEQRREYRLKPFVYF